MARLFLGLSFWLIFPFLQGQNLVPDGDFKLLKRGDFDREDNLARCSAHWYSPSDATPDILFLERLPAYAGRLSPYSGKTCGGLFAWIGKAPAYREFLSTALSEALKPGQAYTLRFAYARSPEWNCPSPQFGAALSPAPPLDLSGKSAAALSPIWQMGEAAIQAGLWQEACVSFVALAPDACLSFGPFGAFGKTPDCPSGQNPEQLGAYILIDAIELVEGGGGCPEALQVPSLPVFELPALGFDSGEAELRPEALPLLDSLCAHLAARHSQVRIVGHTDNVGQFADKLLLSQRRAEAVAAHLRRCGIAPERLRCEGQADLEPIAPNDTPEGRARNRRVLIFWED